MGAPFSNDDLDKIRVAIRKKYAAVAASAEGYFRYPVGRSGAELLGYDRELLLEMPDDMLQSFCGVGNPFAIENIEEGSTILDIGCGAGFDLAVACRLVGKQGKVCGVDLTREMIDKARRNLAALHLTNGEVHHVQAERLPFTDACFDVVISNGVINLSPDKARLFAEIFRVLKPGGRVQFADIILSGELPAHLRASVESWSQ